MTAGEINEVSRSLGALQSSVDTLTRTWAEQDRKATEGRRDLHRKLEELREDVTKMRGQLDMQEKKIDKIEPSVRRFEDGQQHTAGVKYVIGLIWAALVLGVSGIAYMVHDWFAILWPPKH
jgi:chromosome segregation ATPase